MASSDSRFSGSRRAFMQTAATALVAIPLAKLVGKTFGSEAALAAAAKEVPPPAGTTPVSVTDPVASALGYKPDKKDVDVKRYPQIAKPTAKTQFCRSCTFFTKANESWGKCQMIQNGVVNAGGWCGSWQKKA